MARKLKAELDVDTSKAKRKVAADLNGAAEGASAAGGDASSKIDRAAKSIDEAAGKTARGLGKLDEATGGVNRQMLSATRAFAGMAAGLAVSYASRYFAEGSAGRAAMDYGGSMLAGAASGAMAGAALGPGGAAVGAAVGAGSGAVKTYLDKEGEIASRLEDFEKSERIFEGISKWQAKLRELSESLNTDEIREILANFKNSEQHWKEQTREAIKGERYTDAGDYQRELGSPRDAQKQLEALLRRAERSELRASAPAPAASIAALDSLARIGGSFAGSDGGFRDLQRVNEKQVALLEKIEAKTGKGAGVF